MDNFKITKTIIENINEQDDKIEQCINVINGFAKDQELNQEMSLNEQIRQQNELIRQEQYNNNENRFAEINQQLEEILEILRSGDSGGNMSTEEINNIITQINNINTEINNIKANTLHDININGNKLDLLYNGNIKKSLTLPQNISDGTTTVDINYILQSIADNKEGVFRICSANIKYYANITPKQIAEFMASRNIDLYCLQENYNNNPNLDDLTILNLKYSAINNGSDERYPTVSSYEILKEEWIDIIKSNSRGTQRIECIIMGRVVSIYNVHLVELQQKAQLTSLKNILDNDSNKYKIVMGDFNSEDDLMWDEVLGTDYKSMQGLNGNWYPTWDNSTDGWGSANIDNIIVSNNISFKKASVYNAMPDKSDHNWLIAELYFNDTQVNNGGTGSGGSSGGGDNPGSGGSSGGGDNPGSGGSSGGGDNPGSVADGIITSGLFADFEKNKGLTTTKWKNQVNDNYNITIQEDLALTNGSVKVIDPRINCLYIDPSTDNELKTVEIVMEYGSCARFNSLFALFNVSGKYQSISGLTDKNQMCFYTYYDANKLDFWNGDSGKESKAITTIETGVRYHFTITLDKDNGQIKLYLNGGLLTTIEDSLTTLNYGVRIGKVYGADKGSENAIYHYIRMYNRILTDEEILSNYNTNLSLLGN